MQIVEYDRHVLPSLTRLINEQMAGIPPGCAFTEQQIDQTIERGGLLWKSHFPDQSASFFTARTVCVLEKREVVAAAQWLIPSTGSDVCALLWIVAHPKHPIPLKTLLHLVEKQAESSGCTSIEPTRCSFGAGWSGIPAIWTHVVKGLREAGYEPGEKWLLMHGETDVHNTILADADPRVKLYWDMNKPALEWKVTAYTGETQVGQCLVWGVPALWEGCPNFAEWATVESLEVNPDQRRRGFGKRLIAEQMRFQARRGIQHFLVWVGEDNEAARKLTESLQFFYGQELLMLRKR